MGRVGRKVWLDVRFRKSVFGSGRLARLRGDWRAQGRLTVLEEATDGGVTLEADGDLVGVVGFGAFACLGEQFGARRPIGLVFGEPRIGGYGFDGFDGGGGSVEFRDGEGAIDGDHW